MTRDRNYRPSKLMRRLRKGHDPTDMTYENVLCFYYDVRDEWLKSSGRRKTIELLEHHKPAQGWGITHAVLFGVGNFANDRMERVCRNHLANWELMNQLARFIDLVDYLTPEGGKEIPIYAQELEWTDLELKVLDFLEFKVIWHPAAWALMKPGCFMNLPFACRDIGLLGRCRHRLPTLRFSNRISKTINTAECAIAEAKEKIKDNAEKRKAGIQLTPDDECLRGEPLEDILVYEPREIEGLKRFMETHIEVELPQDDEDVGTIHHGECFQFEKPGLPALGEEDSCAACAKSRDRKSQPTTQSSTTAVG